MFGERNGTRYANLQGNLKSAKRNSDVKFMFYFRPAAHPSLFRFRFISPWSTTALNSATNGTTNTLSLRPLQAILGYYIC
jgi:hypothetical protein